MPLSVCDFLWCERGDDFSEARVAAQRIPCRIQNKLAVIGTIRQFGGRLEPVYSQVAFAGPGIDQRELGDDITTCEQILCIVSKLDRATTFAQRLFLSAEASVDQTQAGKDGAEVRPR